jgi:hypothetical protein
MRYWGHVVRRESKRVTSSDGRMSGYNILRLKAVFSSKADKGKL